MTIVNLAGRICAGLLLSTSLAVADDVLGVSAAEDGAVETSRQCDVYVAGTATSRRAEPLRYRWLDDGAEVSPWQDVRADGTAPLELCGLEPGSHTLILEVTDGRRTAADRMTATIVSAAALVAGR